MPRKVAATSLDDIMDTVRRRGDFYRALPKKLRDEHDELDVIRREVMKKPLSEALVDPEFIRVTKRQAEIMEGWDSDGEIA